MCAGVFDGDGGDGAAVDAARHVIDAHLAVETFKVQQGEIGAPAGARGKGPVDGDVLVRRDPGVAVACIHKVEILGLIAPRIGAAAEHLICAVYEQLSAGDAGSVALDDVVKEQLNAACVNHLYRLVVNIVLRAIGNHNAGLTARDVHLPLNDAAIDL